MGVAGKRYRSLNCVPLVTLVPFMGHSEIFVDKKLAIAEKRLDPSSRKRKRNGYLMRLTQQSGKREKQKAKTRNDIKN